MIGFANLTLNIGVHVEAILDVILLVLLSTPVIYIWILKPYVVANDHAIHQISHMAFHDSLTKLANRHLLKEFLEKVMSDLLKQPNSFNASIGLIDLCFCKYSKTISRFVNFFIFLVPWVETSSEL